LKSKIEIYCINLKNHTMNKIEEIKKLKSLLD